MDIIFVSFQGINKENVPEGMTRLILPILEYLHDVKYYYVSYAPVKRHRVIRVVSPLHFYFRKLGILISKIFNLHYGIIRLYEEFLFDFFLSLHIKERSVIVSTAYVPITAYKNKKLGGINIFIAGNPYEGYINELLKFEKKKYKIDFEDAYTYQKRLSFINSFLRLQDHIITQTEVTYKSYLTFFDPSRVSLQEVHILPDKKLFRNDNIKKSDRLRFVYIAHTVWLKGLVYLIEAWNKLQLSDAELVIGGNIHKAVMKIIRKYKNPNVKFVGPVYSNNLNNFYRQGHVCIVPSLADDHPATILEALYCGLPVIATEGCGSRSLIKDGENGFIVPIADSNALADRIQWFVNNKDKIEKMSLHAKETIHKLERSNQYEAFANHIYNIIEQLKSGGVI